MALGSVTLPMHPLISWFAVGGEDAEASLSTRSILYHKEGSPRISIFTSTHLQMAPMKVVSLATDRVRGFGSSRPETDHAPLSNLRLDSSVPAKAIQPPASCWKVNGDYNDCNITPPSPSRRPFESRKHTAPWTAWVCGSNVLAGGVLSCAVWRPVRRAVATCTARRLRSLCCASENRVDAPSARPILSGFIPRFAHGVYWNRYEPPPLDVLGVMSGLT